MFRTQSNHRRRGTIYVMVAATATLVLVIGLSGLAVARIHTKKATQTNDWMEAWVLAVSATEQAMSTLDSLTVNDIPTWRTVYTSGQDAFTASSFGRGTFRWQLIDENDDDLANNNTDPVRLYGIGQVGDAIRVNSVLLRVVGVGPNLLNSWDMETNEQDVTNIIANGATYTIGVWMKLSAGTDSARIVLNFGEGEEGEGGQGILRGPETMVGSNKWTRVTAMMTTSWSGTLEAAFLQIETTEETDDFDIDDAVMKVAGVHVAPSPKSWQWDSLP